MNLRPVVLLSANEPWNLINFRKPVIRALQQRGVAIAAAAALQSARDHQAVAQLEQLGCSFHPIPIAPMGTRLRDDVATLIAYVRLMRRIRPSAYLGWTIKPNIYGALAARFCDVPAILNISGLGTAFLETSTVARVAQGLYRVSLRKAHAVLFQNEADRAEFVTRKLVRSAQACLVNGSGIDLEHFRPRPPERGAGTSFLMIARLIGDKGVREYVAAARALKAEDPSLCFRLLGFLDVENRSAISRRELTSWIDEGVIDFHPAVEDVRPHIAAAAYVVLPSYREGTSRVLLEAAAMARPIVTCDVPGCRDVVEDGVNGFLCQPRDPLSLTAAMRRACHASEDDRVHMGEAGRAIAVARYSEEAVAQAYAELLASATTPGAATR
ncbi:glycosyltransferase family 4 protein [Sphingomonas sp.]|uniref:glycosyltransferase family 4 protein n=1 Tax=Sphingomonas sp. TaxID=28214 RepID=UPI003B3BA5DB